MTLFRARPRPSRELRAFTAADLWGDAHWPGEVSSGEHVTESTALGLPAVWACVDLLSGLVASLPVDALTGVARPVEPAPILLREPSARLSSGEWMAQAMVSLLIYGNAYGLVTDRDRMGRPVRVEWLPPATVVVDDRNVAAPPTYSVNGESTGRIWHLRAFTVPGSAVGVAPLDRHKETVGLGLAARRYGAQYFGANAHPSALLYTDAEVTEAQAVTLKERFKAAVRKREVFVAGAGVKYQQTQTAPNESQYLETQDRIAAEVARIFGVPSELIGVAQSGGQSSVTYANREQRAADFLMFHLNRWLSRLEEALTSALPRPQYVKFNTGALLRSDLFTRYQSYAIGLDKGFLTVDEVRALEDRPPLGGVA